jgi:MFS family permease
MGYVAFQLPENLILHRFGARRVIPVIVLAWGLAATSMGLVRTDHEFYAVRFLLGTAEAPFFPGMIIYIALWFPAAYRGSIVALFTMASPISNMIGLPFSALLGELNGVLGLKGLAMDFLCPGTASRAPRHSRLVAADRSSRRCKLVKFTPTGLARKCDESRSYSRVRWRLQDTTG